MNDLVKRLREAYGGEWRCVGGKFANYYACEDGRILSVRRQRAMERILKTWTRSGYPSVSMCHSDGSRDIMLSHRVVYTAFNGEVPTGMEVRHIDGDKINCRLDNLTIGTKQQNAEDKRNHGTHLCGENTPSAKLSWNDVCDIRAAKGVISQAILARSYGVCRTTIQRAQSGETWKKQK